MIQIASGLIRGLSLKSPRSKDTRPTGEKLRQAIFNILRHYRFKDPEENLHPILEGATVADIFAGTGAWGIEAASNGAYSVCFVESNGPAIGVLTANLALADKAFQSQDLEVEFEIFKRDAAQSYAKLPKVRVMFCDPPYSLGFFEKIVRMELSHDRIEIEGLLIFEEAAKTKLDFSELEAAGLVHFDRKDYGDTSVYFFVKRKK